MRAWELRDDIIAKEEDNIVRFASNGMTLEEVKKVKDDLLEYKRTKIGELDEKISKLVDELIILKVKINKKNAEVGLDEKLQRMKYIRIELSKIMNALKKNKHSYSDKRLDVETREGLSLDKRIKTLEVQKASLDAEIQALNWSVKLE